MKILPIFWSIYKNHEWSITRVFYYYSVQTDHNTIKSNRAFIPKNTEEIRKWILRQGRIIKYLDATIPFPLIMTKNYTVMHGDIWVSKRPFKFSIIFFLQIYILYKYTSNLEQRFYVGFVRDQFIRASLYCQRVINMRILVKGVITHRL